MSSNHQENKSSSKKNDDDNDDEHNITTNSLEQEQESPKSKEQTTMMMESSIPETSSSFASSSAATAGQQSSQSPNQIPQATIAQLSPEERRFLLSNKQQFLNFSFTAGQPGTASSNDQTPQTNQSGTAKFPFPSTNDASGDN